MHLDLYCKYTKPVAENRSQHFIQCDLYADDFQLCTSPSPDIDNQSEIVSNLENSISDISKWVSTNKLELNHNKTEFIGVYFDQEFSMEKHVNQLCKSSYFILETLNT